MQTIKFNPEDWVNDELSMKQYADGSIVLFDYKFEFSFGVSKIEGFDDIDNFQVTCSYWDYPIVIGWKEDDGSWLAYQAEHDPETLNRTGETPQLAAAKILANII